VALFSVIKIRPSGPVLFYQKQHSAEKRWSIVAENRWYIVAEKTWYIVAEKRWSIVAENRETA